MVVDAGRAGDRTQPLRATPAEDWRAELGAAIREARCAAGLSQHDLAAALEVRQSSVSQWERGATAPATMHLLGLFDRLGAALAWLLVGEEDAVGERDTSSGTPPP